MPYDDKIIPMFLGSHACYDAMPKSGKVILLSTDLLVKNAFSCLVTNEIRAAPLWDSTSRSFVGMLTISDFINVLRHYYYSSREDIKDIENQKILTWRKITQVEKPFMKIGPNESLAQATKLLIHEGVHRLPVYEERRNSVLFIITRRRLLQYLYNNLIDKFGKTNAKTPLFFKKTIGELKLGTLENIAKITLRSNVIEALDLFVERNVSALPVVDDDGLLVDIFAKFDVFALAKEQTYHNLDMNISEALDKASVHEDGYVCTLDETLGAVIERFFVLKVHRLVVVDGKHTVIGMLSLSDILKFLVLQPLAGLGDTDLAVSDTIEETPEGAVGGADSDTSVFFGAEKEENSSDLAKDLIKLQISDDADAPASEDPHE
ncbi:5'-AMP-activated protein kinase subunit gamma-1-like isoform X2 [Stegodyphus dumicola]|uniref:5'-AMP-activated protein kinase subunit gamma-1-like isoform X2 n=1 Tax=Stegodyphus dumicola TaxID=202533 RepID=UPI0015ADC215|nr:5'-AMP-activated protein kinase subunit gamma-1-like isoform X2 [Stegodyphus dumicola]